MKKIKKLINLVLLVILIFSAGLLFFTTVSPTKKFFIFKVISGSMEPSIRTGSIVFVEHINPKNIQKGDIVSYFPENNEDSIVTHRVLEINNEFITTKGDANNIGDLDKITPERIRGKVVFSLPFVGYLLNWLKTPPGFIITVVIPALYIIIGEFIKIKKAFEKDVIEKYKKQNLPPTPTIVILCCLSALSLINLDQTYSYFSSGTVLSENSISTVNWLVPSPSPTPTPTRTVIPTPTQEATSSPTIEPSPSPI